MKLTSDDKKLIYDNRHMILPGLFGRMISILALVIAVGTTLGLFIGMPIALLIGNPDENIIRMIIIISVILCIALSKRDIVTLCSRLQVKRALKNGDYIHHISGITVVGGDPLKGVVGIVEDGMTDERDRPIVIAYSMRKAGFSAVKPGMRLLGIYTTGDHFMIMVPNEETEKLLPAEKKQYGRYEIENGRVIPHPNVLRLGMKVRKIMPHEKTYFCEKVWKLGKARRRLLYFLFFIIFTGIDLLAMALVYGSGSFSVSGRAVFSIISTIVSLIVWVITCRLLAAKEKSRLEEVKYYTHVVFARQEFNFGGDMVYTYEKTEKGLVEQRYLTLFTRYDKKLDYGDLTVKYYGGKYTYFL